LINSHELKNVSVVIPAHNEENGIAGVISQVQSLLKQGGYQTEIIVINDGSGDKTPGILSGFGDSIKVITHGERKGYGASLISGIAKSRYDTVAIIDADDTYGPEDLLMLLNNFGNYDMLVGARIGEGVKIPFVRRPAKWFVNKLANYLSGENIPDLNSGLRIMKKQVVLEFRRILPRGFSFTTTITLAMMVNNYEVGFLPIKYRLRKGKSKINPLRDTFNFIQLVARTVMYFAPLKIFLPFGLMFLLSFLAVFIYDIINGNITDKTVLLFVAFFMITAIGFLADMIDKRL
jgi:glycosyltransferase involved in cell wall biosynthesis